MIKETEIKETEIKETEIKETDEIYGLTLTTSNTNTNKSNNPVFRTAGNYADVTWTIDYDDIFKGRQKLFKFCRIRFNLQQGSSTYTWNTQSGYLCCNIPSSFNSQNTLLPTVLGLLYAQQNPNSNGVNPQVYTVSTLNEVGVDVNLNSLYGRQLLNLKWCNDDANTTIANITNDWEIYLSFHLYN